MSAETPVPTGTPSLFRWECGPSGEIAWVDGAPRGALIGRTIARVQEDEGDRVDEDVVRAFSMRAPFRDAELTVAGDGILAGAWKISGVPAFEPTDGRFAGYRGVALRETAPPVESGISLDILADPDSLRELVHEINTPLNAIIGFAEIIEGQYLGPADHRYRARAAEIVTQARVLLGAIDDLDFAAKIHSSAAPADRRTDLAQLLVQIAGELNESASARQVEIDIETPASAGVASIEPELAERLLNRLGNAAIERAEVREHIRLSADCSAEACRVSVSRPAALRNLSDIQLFDASSVGAVMDAPVLPIAFTLRVVRGLASIAGGELVTTPTEFVLTFPRA